MTMEEYRSISAIFSCTRRIEGSPIAPTLSETTSVISSVAYAIIINLLLGKEVHNEVRVITNDWRMYSESIAPSETHPHLMGF